MVETKHVTTENYERRTVAIEIVTLSEQIRHCNKNQPEHALGGEITRITASSAQRDGQER